MPQNKMNRDKDTKKNTDPKKKRGGPEGPKGPKDQDDDVDDNGNIKNLINYDYDSEVSSEDERVSKKKGGFKPKGKAKKVEETRPRRKAAIKAEKKIAKKLQKGRRRDGETSSDSSFHVEEEEEDESPKVKRRSRKMVVESDTEDEEDGETLGSEDSYTEDEEEDEEEDEYDEEDDEDEDEDEEKHDEGFRGLSIIFGGGADGIDAMVPKRHNMKKESQDVRRFVKLISKPVEEETIDDQIDQFKGLEQGKQKAMIEALEMRSNYSKKEQPLMFRLLQMKLTPETMAVVMSRYNALNTMDPSSGEYYKLRSWMEKLVSIPLGIYKDMPVRIEDGPEMCGPFMEKARRYLDDAIFGQDEAKLQIQQFIASKIANPTSSGLSLLLIGPPGIGKTSLIKGGIAKALNWPFQFISLGGDSDATTYTGHQFVYEGSHCGKIANCLAQAKSMSMIMMFDELDKVSSTAKGEEVQNLLVHLTDPVQNMDFEDKYLSGIPLDLSRTMFVFSGNDITKIDRILLDRMVVVELKGYKSEDKLEIAEKYLLPEALREVNLGEKVAISRSVLKHVLDEYASEETGVRELKRCIGQIVQRINMLRMFNVKELPFHIPGFTLPFVLKKEHVDLFLKKRDKENRAHYNMYV
jgi:ATP-dependent Lon protease